MPSLDMNGPFSFTNEEIDSRIRDNKIGNYALGSKNSKGGLNVSYVGRSDTDLKAELKQRLETHDHSHFKASYANSPKEAFEKECKNYHDFGGKNELENKIHPARPKNVNWKCTECRVYD